MRCYRILCAAALLGLLPANVAAQDAAPASQAVVLLHGLGRTPRAMACLRQPLEAAGYTVHNLGYPSRQADIATLAGQVAEALDARGLADTTVHAVTHSMGGILLRQLVAEDRIQVGRAVMYSPPNHGSAVIDHLRKTPGFAAVMGPAALQLSTDADSVPNQLGAATFALGIIAGTRSYNPLFSHWIAGDDDGKVSVASARLDGMADFLALPVNHTNMMCNAAVQAQTLHFLDTGAFQAE